MKNIFKGLFKESVPVIEGEIAKTADTFRSDFAYYTPDKLITRKRFEIFDEMMLDEEIESGINTLK